MPTIASDSNLGFSILLKDTLPCRLERPGIEPPTVGLVADLLSLPAQNSRKRGCSFCLQNNEADAEVLWTCTLFEGHQMATPVDAEWLRHISQLTHETSETNERRHGRYVQLLYRAWEKFVHSATETPNRGRKSWGTVCSLALKMKCPYFQKRILNCVLWDYRTEAQRRKSFFFIFSFASQRQHSLMQKHISNTE